MTDLQQEIMTSVMTINEQILDTAAANNFKDELQITLSATFDILDQAAISVLFFGPSDVKVPEIVIWNTSSDSRLLNASNDELESFENMIKRRVREILQYFVQLTQDTKLTNLFL